MATSGFKNGSKKSGTRLDGEINDILAARQRREQRAASPAPAPAPSRVPSQVEYERRERAEAHKKLDEVERAPLADRKASAAEFLEAMREYPEIVGERVGWLLNGSYGYGSKLMARQVLQSPRMNRSAALTHMIAAFEWSTPGAMAIAGWKKLTKAEQASLDRAVRSAIKSAESEE